MIAGKPTLSLPKTVQADRTDDDRPFELAVYDVLLPCRQFVVTHKVAELGRISMTAEFLLRLLRSVDGMDETDFGTFFGFDPLESGYVIREAEESGYVTRRNGRLWLTMTGRGLFRDGAEEPQIYDVDTKTVTAGFDLLSIAPAEREPLSRFELKLPELKVEDVGKLSRARKLVPAAFHRFYGEFRSRFGTSATKNRSLYSVDHVRPADRFSSLVRIVARSRAGRPGFPEPDLSEWKTGYELDDRSPVIERSAAFLEDLRTFRRPDDAGAYGLLAEIAGDSIDAFMNRGELNVSKLFKAAVASEVDTRSDNPATPIEDALFTVPMAGSLFTAGNVRRFFEALGYATRLRKHRPQTLFWLVPQVPAWGATRVLPTTLDQIEKQLGAPGIQDEEFPARSVAFVAGEPPRHVLEAFDLTVSGPDFGSGPPTIEVLVVPGLVAAVQVHAPIGAIQAFPVPLGVLSFDERVVRRAHEALLNYLPFLAVPSGKSANADPRAFIEKALG